ncbi:hypothetical protein F4009_13160 [Candidatus Poribacteria bacterium]|nr:hypothetical protein [Candidatus Poribacteria bacterium]MYK94923.1 hypothetical protein [Candidatus Poribacteria bacterium]
MEVKKSDLIASALKGVCGALPLVGSSIAEIISYLIPNQRLDRIASFLKVLESKIDPEEAAKVEARILEEKSIDLMEDGFLQAARALSKERIDYIASLLKNSLTDEDLERIAYKKLLSILAEINDVEVLILKSYSGSIAQQQKFRQKHQQVVTGTVVHLGSSQEEVDKHAIHETYRTNLARLNLLKIRFQQPRRGESAEFDEKTGMMKASGYEITSLGRLLLRSIDQDGNIQ